MDRTDPHHRALAAQLLDQRIAQVREKHIASEASKNLWLSHHWPQQYHKRCTTISGRWVCTRCAALHPMGLMVALMVFAGFSAWPASWNIAVIWLLGIPATVAYCGEAIGLFGYNKKVQVATMLVGAVAYGTALSYELGERWSTEFWHPVAVFGSIWLLATYISHTTR